VDKSINQPLFPHLGEEWLDAKVQQQGLVEDSEDSGGKLQLEAVHVAGGSVSTGSVSSGSVSGTFVSGGLSRIFAIQHTLLFCAAEGLQTVYNLL
jgi:hypothetical protein